MILCVNTNEEYVEEDAMASNHIASTKCQCFECLKAKDRYVRIIDVDRFVDNLNDWD